MKLGGTIRVLRAAVGISQKELARRLSISPSYLSQIEGDKRATSIALLRAIAHELGTPAAILFAVALASEDLGQGREEELEAIRKLVSGVRLNLLSQQLPLEIEPSEAA